MSNLFVMMTLIDIDLSFVVCHVPDMDLVRVTENIKSIDRAGLFLATNHNSTCSGRALKIEACAETSPLKNSFSSMNVLPFRIGVAMYYFTEELLYKRRAEEIEIVYPAFQTAFQCTTRTLSLGDNWFIHKGDVFAARVFPSTDTCDDRPMDESQSICPAWAAFMVSQMTGPIAYSSVSDQHAVVNSLQLEEIDGFVNGRVIVG